MKIKKTINNIIIELELNCELKKGMVKDCKKP
jgi:hypothetical protein